jgi:hypothetical protein
MPRGNRCIQQSSGVVSLLPLWGGSRFLTHPSQSMTPETPHRPLINRFLTKWSHFVGTCCGLYPIGNYPLALYWVLLLSLTDSSDIFPPFGRSSTTVPPAHCDAGDSCTQIASLVKPGPLTWKEFFTAAQRNTPTAPTAQSNGACGHGLTRRSFPLINRPAILGGLTVIPPSIYI